MYYKFDYLFIKPNKKLCTKVIQDYFFFNIIYNYREFLIETELN